MQREQRFRGANSVVDVSVVVCTRDRCASLRKCLAALAAIRTRLAWELVVVDNGSTDDTQSFLATVSAPDARNRIVTASEPRVGVAIAKNTGWRLASGAIIAFTDDDCYVAADFVDTIHLAFSERANVGFIAGRILLHDPTDLRITILELNEPLTFAPDSFIAAGALQGANMAFRRQTLEQIGGFDERFGPGTKYVCDDIDAAAAALWLGIPGAYDPRPTVFHAHGRRTKAQGQHITWTYDVGRGAYYAKYLLDRRSRRTYAKAWLRSIAADFREAHRGLLRGRIHTMVRSRREIIAGIRFAVTARRRHDQTGSAT